MNIVELLKPNIQKIGVTLGLFIVIGLLVQFGLGGSFIGLLLTPTYTLYADEAYTYINWYILLWIPLYVLGCFSTQVLKQKGII